jgi:hypothetical protein
MIKYAIALAILLILAAVFAWAFLPARYLPGNRARHLRIRLHLRLHPGKGFAHVVSLHLRWGRLASLRRSARIRRSLPLRQRLEEAVRVADSTGDIEPAVEARSWLARAHLQLGNATAALAATTARREPPYPTGDPTMRLLEGLALLELHRTDEGVRAFCVRACHAWTRRTEGIASPAPCQHGKIGRGPDGSCTRRGGLSRDSW